MGYLFNYHQEIIDITSPQTEVEAQQLANEIRRAEFQFTGMAYGKIADMSGKEDLGGGVITGITIELIPNWQIRFWEGTYTAKITGGNILGGLNGNPIAYTAGVQVIIVQSASSTLVYGSGGMTQAEHDKLMTGLDVSIPDAVWDELLSQHQITGSAGRSLTRAERKAALSAIKK
jgi:hypothetical protein